MFQNTTINPAEIAVQVLRDLRPLTNLHFSGNPEKEAQFQKQLESWLNKKYQESPEFKKRLRACRRRRENPTLPLGSKQEQLESLNWITQRTNAWANHLLNRSISKIIVHPGTFHADDTFAAAAALLLAPGAELLRKDPTPEELEDPHVLVLDIGGIYNPAKRCFDHHQRRDSAGDEVFRPEHAENQPMAAFGLLWNTYGDSIVTQVAGELNNTIIAEKIQYSLVRHVDAEDNGKIVEQFTVSKLISRMNLHSPNKGEGFLFAVNHAKEILLREIQWHQEALEASNHVWALIQQTPGHVLEFEKHYVWKKPASHENRIWFAIYPSDREGWVIECSSPKGNPMEQKVPMPEWTISDEQKREEFGIIFSHTGHFLAVCDTADNARRLTRAIIAETNTALVS
jgi:uncharacterized UPF0160 family protein